jgi:hypothetical protein
MSEDDEGRFDDEAREQREIEYRAECHSRDIEQGVERAGVFDIEDEV